MKIFLLLTLVATISGFAAEFRELNRGTLADGAFVWVREGTPVECGDNVRVRLLRRTAAGYREVGVVAARGSWFGQVRLSSADRLGRRLFLVAGTAVQCASTHTRLDWELWSVPATGPRRIVAARKEFIWQQDDETFAVTSAGVSLAYHLVSRDVVRHNYVRVENFRVVRGGLVQVEPWATSAQNYFEEWIRRPASEVRAWAPASLNVLRQSFHAEGYREFERVRYCPESKESQIGMDGIDQFVRIRETGPQRYRIVGATANPTCPVAERERP